MNLPVPEFIRVAFPEDRPVLARFLAESTWPFHGESRHSLESAEETVASGRYESDDRELWWLRVEGRAVGLIQLLDMDDIDDGNPRFDLRIAEPFRGRGLGRAAVRWLTAHLFESHPNLRRIEGVTRVDNHAMQRAFRACLYVAEGYYREAWRSDDGGLHDCVQFAIIRRDWESGRATPVPWRTLEAGGA